MYLAIGFVFASPLLAVLFQRWTLFGAPDRPVAARQALALPLATLSLGAAAIHAGVIADHFQEYWLFGALFLLTTVFQTLWAVAFILRPTTILAVLGAGVNAVIAAVWAVSRTLGLPIGPHAGEPERIQVNDTLATAFQLLLIVGLVALGLPRLRSLLERHRYAAAPASLAVVMSLVLISLATVLGVVSGAIRGHGG